VKHQELVRAQMEFDHTKKKRATEWEAGPSIIHVLSGSSSSLDCDFWNSFNSDESTMTP
jgi:hypothetical protein